MWPGRGKGLKNIGIGVVGDTALVRRRPRPPGSAVTASWAKGGRRR